MCKKKTPKLKELLKSQGIEIGNLSKRSGMSASSFRSKISENESYRYFSDQEYTYILDALKMQQEAIKSFLKHHDRVQEFKK